MMNISYNTLIDNGIGLVARNILYEEDLSRSHPVKQDLGKNPCILDSAFNEDYAHQCLCLAWYEYLGQQVTPLSAYGLAMMAECRIDQLAGTVDCSGGYLVLQKQKEMDA